MRQPQNLQIFTQEAGMNFGEVLTRAWNIIWNNKILWWFGFFASLGAGGSSSNFNYNLGGGDFNFPNTQNIPPQISRLFENVGVWLPVVLLLGLLLIVLMVVLNTFGRIGLARGAWLADETPTGSEGQARLTFSTLWQSGRRYFWRVLLLILLLWALAFTLGIIVLIPVIGLSVMTLGIAFICLLPLLCLLVIVFWGLTVLADLAVIGIVNEDRDLLNAISQAWSMLKSRPVDILVTAVILWIVSTLIGVVLSLPIILIMAPVIGSLIFQSEAYMRGGILVSAILFILYLPVLMFAQSIIRSYLSTAWTLVYRRISRFRQNLDRSTVIDIPANPQL
jgi:hypothetical protein